MAINLIVCVYLLFSLIKLYFSMSTPTTYCLPRVSSPLRSEPCQLTRMPDLSNHLILYAWRCLLLLVNQHAEPVCFMYILCFKHAWPACVLWIFPWVHFCYVTVSHVFRTSLFACIAALFCTYMPSYVWVVDSCLKLSAKISHSPPNKCDWNKQCYVSIEINIETKSG